jgi:hypothetical protein
MDTDVLVALISAIVALVIAGWTAWQGRRDRQAQDETAEKLELLRSDLAAEARRSERADQARDVLDVYRRPLAASAAELKRRLGNIEHNSFLGYASNGDHRAEIAIRSTLYRFAAYLGWRESLSRRLTFLTYEDSDKTKNVTALLEDVGSQLSDSRIKHAGSPRLMLWKDEQRAIGGLMCPTDAPAVIGFETFFKKYDEVFAPWFQSFAADLRMSGIESAERLSKTAQALGALIAELDEEGVFAGRV